jgi:hypothetical protein
LARGAPCSVYALRIFACQIIYWPRHLAGSAVSEYFLLINVIFFIILSMIYFLSKFERLEYHVPSVFSVDNHIRDQNLLRDIILFYLSSLFRILICLKVFLLWPLVGTEKVGMWSSWFSGYSVGSHLYIFHFVIFTGCGPLTLGWYNVGSYLFPICQFMGSYLILAIWQLNTYYICLLLFCKINYQISKPEYVLYSCSLS